MIILTWKGEWKSTKQGEISKGPIGWFYNAMKKGGYVASSDGFVPEEERVKNEMLELLKKRKF